MSTSGASEAVTAAGLRSRRSRSRMHLSEATGRSRVLDVLRIILNHMSVNANFTVFGQVFQNTSKLLVGNESPFLGGESKSTGRGRTDCRRPISSWAPAYPFVPVFRSMSGFSGVLISFGGLPLRTGPEASKRSCFTSAFDGRLVAAFLSRNIRFNPHSQYSIILRSCRCTAYANS